MRNYTLSSFALLSLLGMGGCAGTEPGPDVNQGEPGDIEIHPSSPAEEVKTQDDLPAD